MIDEEIEIDKEEDFLYIEHSYVCYDDNKLQKTLQAGNIIVKKRVMKGGREKDREGKK